MNNYFIFFLLLTTLVACKTKSTYVQLSTTKGDIVLKLYDETPLHQENFVKLVKDGYFDGVLFHRVIDEFMIQSGDPDSKNAKPKERLGNGGPDYKIDAEFNDSLFHKRGALGAARDNNPKKSSSGSQFYIVEGKKWTDVELDKIIEKTKVDEDDSHTLTLSEEQREYYKEIGGTPFLDQNYTVFGEVVRGMEVVDAISDVSTDRYDRPVEDVKINKATIIKFKE